MQPAPRLEWSLLRTQTELALRDEEDELEADDAFSQQGSFPSSNFSKGEQTTSLCKVRMECLSLKQARRVVKHCENVLDAEGETKLKPAHLAFSHLYLHEAVSLRDPHENDIEEVFDEQGVAHFRVVGQTVTAFRPIKV
ncbi:hypothetical protein Tco_0471267 [Tanacetum coccineum]